MPSSNAFRGLWSRSLIAWPDGRRDVSTEVAWLQGSALFADLRQPPNLGAGLSAAACRLQLTAADCVSLSAQQGFSGTFEAREGAYEWIRRIDYQPKQARRDIGRLSWHGRILVEEGVETEYTEHWNRNSGIAEPASAGLWLSDAARNVSGCLLRAGDWFAYARGRTLEISGDTLASLVAGADSLARMQALVDCEISFGNVSAGWRIERSSLPYRRGMRLAVQRAAENVVLPDLDETGRPIERVWRITEQEGDCSTILDMHPKCSNDG